MRLRVFLALLASAVLISTLARSEDDGEEYLKIALIGTGKNAGKPEIYDPESLAKIFQRVKSESPDMVIFTGNLIQGLEQSTSTESMKKFKGILQSFSRLAKNYLGDDIPLYPVIGNHTFVNTQAVAIFKEHFKIENTAPLEPYQLAYSVNKNNVRLTFLATGEYERKFRGYRLFSRYMPLLDWLEKDVRTGENEAEFRFVIGHEPAFSSEAAAGLFTGAEEEEKENHQLWQILKRNSVLGYFCSHELIYDRSNRNGVWQVISGGVVDKDDQTDSERLFQHYILLLVPKGGTENPIIKAKDISGKVWDEFRMAPVDRPVHHLRISQSG